MERPFEGLLGNNCELRILEFLVPQNGVDYNVSEIAEEIDVTRQTVSKVIKKFEQWEIVKPTKTVRNSTYYTINEKSPFVETIVQFNNRIIEKILGPEELYEIREYLKSQAYNPPTVGSEPVTAGTWMLGQDFEGRLRLEASPPVLNSQYTWWSVQETKKSEPERQKMSEKQLYPIAREVDVT